MPTGKSTMFFIHPSSVPKDKKVTHMQLVASIRPLKAETHRVRVTIGRDRLDYNGFTSTVPASLTIVKLYLNSIISTPDARYMSLDIKDYYYGTPMDDFEYAQLPLTLIPPEIITQYDLANLAVNGRVFCEIRKGMPGLKQAGAIANLRLAAHLTKHGYVQARHTPSLWKHTHLPISFTLVVDDFGVKYIGDIAPHHLIKVLEMQYTISVDWTGSNYLGLTLEWDYKEGHVTISIPKYMVKALQRLKHTLTAKPVYLPSKFIPPVYSAKIQYVKPELKQASLLSATKTFTQ